MKKICKSFSCILLAILLIFTFQFNVFASDNISTCEIADDVVATSVYRVKSKTQTSDTYGSWKKIASNTTGATKNGEILSASVSLSWSNSITGSLSATAKKSLTSTLGFSVTKSGSATAGYSLPLAKGEKGYISARPCYATYNCTIQRKYSGSTTSYWKTLSSTYVAKNFERVDYKTHTYY